MTAVMLWLVVGMYGAISIVLFLIFGGSGGVIDPAEAETLLSQYQRPMGLLLLIPTCVVIFMAVKGINIFACLGTGSALAIIIGLAAGLFKISDLIYLADGKVQGTINTIANICVSPFINAIGKNNDIHPYRRANILVTTICSFPFFLPYGGCVLLLLGGINGQKDVYSFLPSLSAAQIIPTAFYCWAIWGVMLVSCLTGRGRAFEGENGEYIVSKTNPHKVAK